MRVGRSRRLVAALAGALAGLAWTSTAHAGQYDVYSCRGPSGERIGVSGWAATGSAYGFVRDNCSRGGWLSAGISKGTAPEFASSRWVFTAPASTSLAGFDLYRSASSVAQPGFAKGYGLYLDSVDA